MGTVLWTALLVVARGVAQAVTLVAAEASTRLDAALGGRTWDEEPTDSLAEPLGADPDHEARWYGASLNLDRMN